MKSRYVVISLLCSSIAFAGDPPNPGAPAAPAPTSTAKPAGQAPTPHPSTCFELSTDGKAWSKTPELLCIGSGNKAVEITMTTGMPPSPMNVATFRLDLKSRAKCLDCNQDEFALTNPSNSVFNALSIKFDGKRDMKAHTESGTVAIGMTKLHYRRTN